MKIAFTISTHNGSQVAYEHNIRNEKVVSKEPHIMPGGIHENWVNKKVRQAYQELFGDAVKKYNKQQRKKGHPERCVKSYYTAIKNDAQKHPVYEMIITIGNKDNPPPPDLAKEIMREFVDDWQRRNPNLELIGAYYHQDEPQGVPHVHIDYIPVAYQNKTGLEVQTGLRKALKEQGFYTESKSNTAQMKWQRRENQTLEAMCKARGLEIEHPLIEGRRHLETETYKAQKRLEELQRDCKEAQTHLVELQDKIKPLTAKYEALKGIAEDINNSTHIKGVETKKKPFGKEFIQMSPETYEALIQASNASAALQSAFQKIDVHINEFINAPDRKALTDYMKQLEAEQAATAEELQNTIKKINKTLDQIPREARNQFLNAWERIEEPTQIRTIEINNFNDER